MHTEARILLQLAAEPQPFGHYVPADRNKNSYLTVTDGDIATVIVIFSTEQFASNRIWCRILTSARIADVASAVFVLRPKVAASA